MTDGTVRVFLVDRDVDERGRLRRLLESETDLTVVGETEPHADGFAEVVSEAPDVVVARLEATDEGVQLCRDMLSVAPSIECVVMSPFGAEEALIHAILIGATDYVRASTADREVVEAVRRAAGDPRGLGARIAELVDEGITRAVESDVVQELPEQQRRVTELVARGLTNAEIAAELELSVNTVRNYLARIMARLGVHNRTQLATFLMALAASERGITAGRR